MVKLCVILLALVTLGCLAGAFVMAGISTMFETGPLTETVAENVGWTYYLWFITPALLWVTFLGYLALRKR